MMYEVARQLTAERQRTARQAGEAYQQRAAAREARAAARRSRKGAQAQEIVATPVIPDYPHEMFGVGQEAVPAPREEVPGRHSRMRR